MFERKRRAPEIAATAAMTASAPTPSTFPRVLCALDDRTALEDLRRALRDRFDLVLAANARDALGELAQHGPFAVLVTDLGLRTADGAALLDVARAQAPQTTRLVWTRPENLLEAMEAVRHARAFRFVFQPLEPHALADALAACVEQHQLVGNATELFERTLRGSVHALTNLLAMAQPEAFGRASRLCELVLALAREARQAPSWELEITALLSQIGAIALTPGSVSKLYAGVVIDALDQAETRRLPEIGDKLLEDIPRFELVRKGVLYQAKHFDGGGIPEGGPSGVHLPFAARALKLAFDFERLRSSGADASEAYEKMRVRQGVYDPELLDAFRRVVLDDPNARETVKIGLIELKPNMVIAANVYTKHGQLLVVAPQPVHAALIARLRNYHHYVGLRLPLEVRRELQPGTGRAAAA